MAAKAKIQRHPHQFPITFFGVVGYIGTLFVGILILVTIVFIVGYGLDYDFATQPISLSSSSTVVTDATYDSATGQAIQFSLGILGLLATWVFCYLVGKVVSRTIRFVMRRFKMKITSSSIVTAKYYLLAGALVGLVIILQFLPATITMSRTAFALLGFTGGVMAAAAVWVQSVLIRRHNVGVEHIV